MPINIYNKLNFESIDHLCDDVWDLPSLIDSLENWLKKTGRNLSEGSYVADIGFDIRKDASGGGGVINSESMSIMREIGMDVYLSEYPGTMKK
ncbi:hypothetical protein JAO76_05310 [Pontibacter sp. BT310]|uniref:Uncharacterized protein n=1 Tax=Pontibacter populi TaxID=890055 RepID=A0ABS6X8X8_9BACT|nr:MULTISPECIES: hypothetical protein [Pontibacter]MBJ6117596.1 hypothetical protein [Pontibacter sp. BT310]MBR0570021.1 hypothetical protein [Microvirga sp. STS03]MBW3364448.1 hypothetical protein [Pontibacter populi]